MVNAQKNRPGPVPTGESESLISARVPENLKRYLGLIPGSLSKNVRRLLFLGIMHEKTCQNGTGIDFDVLVDNLIQEIESDQTSQTLSR